MSKSILVIDTPEQVCQKCELCRETINDEFMCCGNGKIIPDGEKPDWCPLKELPQKANHPDYCDNGRYDKGWNDCLDEIVKETHD